MKAICPGQRARTHIGRLMVAFMSLLLVDCGGGSDAPSAPVTQYSDIVSNSSAISISPLSSSVGSAMVTPAFYTAPLVLDTPSDVDRNSPSSSAHLPPTSQPVRTALTAISRAQLTPEAIASYMASASSGTSSTLVTTYTPAQIRAAYHLPILPSSWSGLNASQLAQMGAGQTIYIVDAMSDPNIVAELSAFNQKFGLPACTTTVIAPTVNLPLSAAVSDSCEFAVVYSTSGGALTASPPAYDSGWATEIALDVQWAHATAPLARIVLLEAPDASTASLLGAVTLANAMGPGVVSMSFGTAEGTWTASVDSAFSNASMTYVAATGDNGAGVEWPSVSPNVLAVGGTHLAYNGATRNETVWSGTGGGISQFTPVPSYQMSATPGMGALIMRSVADVAFNADPYTGQYVAVITPGGSTPSWYSVGGTSLATPQWAGIAAIANAMRAQNGLGVLGLMQAQLYNRISTNSALYAAAFDDITAGNDGACATCAAHTGYDQPSGLGTPDATNFLTALTTASQTQPPIVSSLTIKGVVGSELSFTVAASAPDPITWSLSNAPAGMVINASGQVTWAQPVAGAYAVTATATDSTTGLSGSATVDVTIAAPSAPLVEPATIVGQVGHALSYQVNVQSVDPVSFSMAGAPTGMAISATGVLAWQVPVAGTYSVTVTATDTKTGLSGNATLHVRISATTSGPVISAAPINGIARHPLVGIVGISDPGARYVDVRIKGAPTGMRFFASGQGILVGWLRPVAGIYAITFTAVDAAGLSAQSTLTVTIGTR